MDKAEKGEQKAEQKVVQYLNEAHATEMGLVRMLQSQIAMTPRGSYRSALEKHLRETRGHAERLEERIGEVQQGGNPVQAGIGLMETVLSQAFALSKAPLDLLRGSGGEEKVLKNARDAVASEALEIATYTALERLAQSVGDETTAKLAASIRADEQRMLETVLREIPKLTDAVVGSDVRGDGAYDVSKTGAADAARKTRRAAGRAAGRTARSGAQRTRTTARQARRVPGVARAEGQAKGAVASEEDLPIARYEELTVEQIIVKLPELSQVDLGKVDSYERRHDDRSTVRDRIASLRADEPWSGYDEQTVADIRAAIGRLDDERAKQVRDYERAHKNRAGVLEATERELTSA